ncbi:uncharacterized protein PpBr36_10174 [Pyricularia pennisetigena]|uniref:uncharacterized protein n=1 Tax=Pyricularia pennisetigena TaxID=1578925 RepID=UPI0011548916|nr:uncharacterized protein PpBr36_10174 [Pyricularia pennisetigena]TLS21573.1 hypothetical protein PpBr36_10174 [Pyricularia pennisetigena]
MTPLKAAHTMKKEVGYQKLRQGWPRRTNQNGRRHGVQCRSPVLRLRLLDHGTRPTR